VHRISRWHALEKHDGDLGACQIGNPDAAYGSSVVWMNSLTLVIVSPLMVNIS
jgi:hypothetical protein